MAELDAVSEPCVHTEQEDDKSKLPETDLLQPPDPNPTGQPGAAWKSGLFACCNNPCNALVTALLPCVTFGQVAEMVDDGNIACCTSIMLYMGMCFGLCVGIGLCCKWKYGLCKQTAEYRTKLRNKFNLAESPALDWVTHLCCHCCALCQEYRELQSRGFDPSLGNFS
ncbi:hypothetical protein Patl1_19123 [Pistacia atlantica]|uniref:Uncharacterized protein n=1 Tax=Pistacia atlantica TaxID=434234 RepID=A0ACC1BXW6_9ROSI|nr:hypothetical protein Patl1_19123 [Pistacia atlantica]